MQILLILHRSEVAFFVNFCSHFPTENLPGISSILMIKQPRIYTQQFVQKLVVMQKGTLLRALLNYFLFP